MVVVPPKPPLAKKDEASLAFKAAKAQVAASKDFIVQNGVLKPRKLSSARVSRSSTAHNSNTFDIVSSSHGNLRPHLYAKKGQNELYMPGTLTNLTPRGGAKRHNSQLRSATTHSSLVEPHLPPSSTQASRANSHSFTFAKTCSNRGSLSNRQNRHKQSLKQLMGTAGTGTGGGGGTYFTSSRL